MAIVTVGRAQGYVYAWTGGQPGFSATITLDALSSPTGGGSVGDILSIDCTIPLPNGQNYSGYYPGYLEPYAPMASITSEETFTWNAEEITSMNIRYVPDAPTFDNWYFGTTDFGDDNPDGLTPARYGPIFDTTGTWQAVAAVPEPPAVCLIILAIGIWRLRGRHWCHGKA